MDEFTESILSDGKGLVSPAGKPNSSFYHKAASYAVWSLVAAIAVNTLMPSSVPQGGGSLRQIGAMIGGVIMLSAIPAGIIALFGIRKHGSRTLLWKGLVGIVVPILLTALAIPAFLKVREISNQQSCKNIAAEINKRAPVMIDQETRLDGAEAGPERTVTIQMTIISVETKNIDMEIWRNKAVPAIRAGIEKSEIMAVVKKGVTLVYRYHGNDGIKIDDVVFRPADYPRQSKR